MDQEVYVIPGSNSDTEIVPTDAPADIPDIINCTACNKGLKVKKKKLCCHPRLDVLLCKSCLKFINSNEFTKDDQGLEEYCTWCGDGGNLVCCDFCEKAYCKHCVKRNLGKEFLKTLLNADNDVKWKCFCCDKGQIITFIEECKAIIEYMKTIPADEKISEPKQPKASQNQKAKKTGPKSETPNNNSSQSQKVKKPAPQPAPQPEALKTPQDQRPKKPGPSQSERRKRLSEVAKQVENVSSERVGFKSSFPRYEISDDDDDDDKPLKSSESDDIKPKVVENNSQRLNSHLSYQNGPVNGGDLTKIVVGKSTENALKGKPESNVSSKEVTDKNKSKFVKNGSLPVKEKTKDKNSTADDDDDDDDDSSISSGSRSKKILHKNTEKESKKSKEKDKHGEKSESKKEKRRKLESERKKKSKRDDDDDEEEEDEDEDDEKSNIKKKRDKKSELKKAKRRKIESERKKKSKVDDDDDDDDDDEGGDDVTKSKKQTILMISSSEDSEEEIVVMSKSGKRRIISKSILLLAQEALAKGEAKKSKSKTEKKETKSSSSSKAKSRSKVSDSSSDDQSMESSDSDNETLSQVKSKTMSKKPLPSQKSTMNEDKDIDEPQPGPSGVRPKNKLQRSRLGRPRQSMSSDSSDDDQSSQKCGILSKKFRSKEDGIGSKSFNDSDVKHLPKVRSSSVYDNAAKKSNKVDEATLPEQVAKGKDSVDECNEMDQSSSGGRTDLMTSKEDGLKVVSGDKEISENGKSGDISDGSSISELNGISGTDSNIDMIVSKCIKSMINKIPGIEKMEVDSENNGSKYMNGMAQSSLENENNTREEDEEQTMNECHDGFETNKDAENEKSSVDNSEKELTNGMNKQRKENDATDISGRQEKSGDEEGTGDNVVSTDKKKTESDNKADKRTGKGKQNQIDKGSSEGPMDSAENEILGGSEDESSDKTKNDKDKKEVTKIVDSAEEKSEEEGREKKKSKKSKQGVVIEDSDSAVEVKDKSKVKKTTSKNDKVDNVSDDSDNESIAKSKKKKKPKVKESDEESSDEKVQTKKRKDKSNDADSEDETPVERRKSDSAEEKSEDGREKKKSKKSRGVMSEDSDSVVEVKDRSKVKISDNSENENIAKSKKKKKPKVKESDDESSDEKVPTTKKKDKKSNDSDSEDETPVERRKSDSAEEKSEKGREKKKSKKSKQGVVSEDSDSVVEVKDRSKVKKTKSKNDEVDDESDDSENESIAKSKKKKKPKVKESDDESSDDKVQTKKRKDKKSNDSDSEDDSPIERRKSKRKIAKKSAENKETDGEDEDDDDDSDIETPKKKKKRAAKRKIAKSSGDSNSDAEKTKKTKKKKSKIKPKKTKRIKCDDSENEDDEAESSPSSSSSDDDDDDVDMNDMESDSSSSDGSIIIQRKSKRLKDNKKKKKSKVKGKNKKGKKKEESDEESEDDDDNDDEKTTPSKSRKQIRRILKDDELDKETIRAREEEEKRRKRLLERTKADREEHTFTVEVVDGDFVLEKNEKKEPVVTIAAEINKHLKPHQRKGVQFIYDCVIETVASYKKGDEGGGCLLAHCMGLGKTLQIVSFVHTAMNNQNIKLKNTLVVCPLNTVLNWEQEFSKWIPESDKIDVFVLSYAPNIKERVLMMRDWFENGGVLITGYEMYRNLVNGSHLKSKKMKTDVKKFLAEPGPELVVCDEGHILKNDASAISKAMNNIATRRRVVLTGTPLQNNLVEYHCMVSFVKPKLLGTRKEFTNRFVNPIHNGQCSNSTSYDVRLMKQRCHVLYQLLAGCVQRQDYSVLTPYLPKKREYTIFVRLGEKQIKMYQHYLEEFVYQDTAQKSKGSSLFSDFMCLARIWTHPWALHIDRVRAIHRNRYKDHSEDEFIDDEEEDDASSESDHGKAKPWTVDTSSDEDEDKRRKRRRKAVSGSSSDDSSSENEEKAPPASSTTRSGRSTRSTRSDATKADTDKSDKKEDEKDDSDSDEIVTVNPAGEKTHGSLRSGINFKDGALNPAREDEKPEYETEWFDKFISEDDQYDLELGGKLILLHEILANAEAVGDKVLVFSQSLTTLDLIEQTLTGGKVGENVLNWCHGVDYFRMDGSTAVGTRKRWSEIFNDPDNLQCRLFLISTKAGSLGINMVAANRVIVFDCSWNPSHDVQSVFRVYRFGQEKPVYVYRFISQGTMEEKIYGRQITKLAVAGRVVDEMQIGRHFTDEEIRELYTFCPDKADESETPQLPKDPLLAEVLQRLHPKFIVRYHEHDLLLENVEAEELSEEERKIAWKNYEDEKDLASRRLDFANKPLPDIPSPHLSPYVGPNMQRMQFHQPQFGQYRFSSGQQMPPLMQNQRYTITYPAEMSMEQRQQALLELRQRELMRLIQRNQQQILPRNVDSPGGQLRSSYGQNNVTVNNGTGNGYRFIRLPPGTSLSSIRPGTNVRVSTNNSQSAGIIRNVKVHQNASSWRVPGSEERTT